MPAEQRAGGRRPRFGIRFVVIDEASTDTPYRIRLERRPGGRRVVVAVGEIDVYAAPELDRTIRRCEDGDATQVVLDLTEATLLDSTALGIIVAAHGRLARLQVPLKLACTSVTIKRVLAVTGLGRLFEIYSSAAAALEGEAGQGPARES